MRFELEKLISKLLTLFIYFFYWICKKISVTSNLNIGSEDFTCQLLKTTAAYLSAVLGHVGLHVQICHPNLLLLVCSYLCLLL